MAAPFGTTNDFGDTITSEVWSYNAGVRMISMHPSLVHLSPLSTVTINLFAETDVDSSSPRWLTRTLASIDQNNAVVEAADYTYTDENVPAHVENVTRHMRKTAQVSGRAMADKIYGAVKPLKNDQIETRLLELRRDMNYAWINSQRVNVDENTATRFRGMLESFSDSSNTTALGGALTLTSIKDTMLKGIYDDGWDPDVIVLPPNLQSAFDLLATASTTRFVDVQNKETISHVNVFDSPYGRVQMVMERDLYLADSSAATGGTNVGTMFACQRDMFQVGYFRRTWMEEPPRDGDRWRGVIQVEFTNKDLAGTAGYSLTTVGTA